MRIICEKKEYNNLPSHQLNNQPLVAGTCRIYRDLKNRSIPVLSPEEAGLENSKEENLDLIDFVVSHLNAVLDAQKFSPQERAIIQAEMIKYLFFLCTSKQEQLAEITADDIPDHVDFLTEIKTSSRNFKSVSGRKIKGSTFDFRSSSGKLGKSGGENYTVSIHADPYWGVKNWLFNAVRHKFGSNRLRIGSSQVTVRAETELNPSILVSGLLASISSTIENFRSSRHSLSSFITAQGEMPKKALFNHVKDPITAGYATALIENGVECEMSSHGAMIVHGGGAREKLSLGLADCIYNHFPGMEALKPRSPLQVPKAFTPGAVIKEIRLKSAMSSNEGGPFNILYAPNFLPWHSCYHGLTASCFETRKCAEVLVKAFQKLDNAQLNIRVKTTVKDVANPSDADERRGLLPDDLNDLYSPDNGVHDESLGSHSRLLQQADLVITEGVTAVMFEALEHRKPVLLLNQSKQRIPSLPAWFYEDLKQREGRSPVYACSSEEPLTRMLEEIRLLHKGIPLKDEELSSYVWV